MTRRFAVSHRAKSKFVHRGLRNYFEYRDLGIARATRGKVVAHVIRARPGKAPHGQWHRHDTDVQFVYVLKGSAVFEYEGVGRVTMK
ncbi:MAG TPA: cupin, partial [Burkholderiales bacterium]|nr:cupin [Burkholderiales bacterium]